jgi:hypothetical protein
MRSSILSNRIGASDADKVAAGLSERAAAGIDSWSNSAHRAVDLVANTMSSAAKQVGDKGHDWLATQQRWTEASRETVRRHPIASVAIALAAGALLSRLSSGLSEH